MIGTIVRERIRKNLMTWAPVTQAELHVPNTQYLDYRIYSRINRENLTIVFRINLYTRV